MKSSFLIPLALAIAALSWAAPPQAAWAQDQKGGCIQNDYDGAIEVDVWGTRPRIQIWVAPKERKCVGDTDGVLITWVYIGGDGLDPLDPTNVRRFDDGTPFDLIRVWKKGTKVTPRGVFDDVGVCRDAVC